MTDMTPIELPVTDTFRDTMRRFPATVTIITGQMDGSDHGMTATAVTSVSMEPPSLVVCLNNRTLLHEILLSSPYFTVNVLAQGHEDMANAFAGKIAPEERFALEGWARNKHGLMQLSTAQANVTCKRMAAMPYGTHTMFVGQVQAARVSDDAASLIYENAKYCAATPVV